MKTNTTPVKTAINSTNKKYDARSTKSHRNIMRATGMTEIISSGVSKLSFAAQIPIKFSQTLLIGFGLFEQELKPHEKLIEGAQFLISAFQTTLMIGLFLAGKELLLISAFSTRVLMLCDMLYQGILIVGWAPSELSKEETDSDFKKV